MPDDASSTAAANGSQAAVAPSESGDVVLAPDGMVAPQQKGAWTAFIKSIMTAPGDLSSLSAPAFLLSGRSVLEMEVHYMSYPELFFDIGRSSDPAERMLRTVRWWLQCLWSNFGAPLEVSRSVRKPYNPILGEQFFCTWSDANSDWKQVSMVAEQVSHHPPVSAFYMECKPMDMYISGSLLTKTRFRGTSVKVDNVGHVEVYIHQYRETYTVTYPEMHLRGLIGGKIFVEITGESHITSSSGFSAKIDHIPKPWFSGEYHHLRGGIWRTENGPNHPIWTLSGQWTTRTYATHVKDKQKIELSDTSRPVTPPMVKPLDQQSATESLKVWAPVTAALAAGDYAIASKEKNAIEEQQRALRREREKNGIKWEPVYFRHCPAPAVLKNADQNAFWVHKDFAKVSGMSS